MNYLFDFQPKIQVASKYERRVDTRSYDDKKKLFEGVSTSLSMVLLDNVVTKRRTANTFPLLLLRDRESSLHGSSIRTTYIYLPEKNKKAMPSIMNHKRRLKKITELKNSSKHLILLNSRSTQFNLSLKLYLLFHNCTESSYKCINTFNAGSR